MKTIGILGGMGPQATWHLESRIHHFAQRRIPQRFNEGYPPLVSVYLRHAPVLVEDGLPTQPLTLDPRMLTAAERLGQWAELIVMSSNTPHFFLEELSSAAGCPIISMIDVAVEELKSRDGKDVGLLGLGIPKVYAERLDREGFTVHTAPREIRDRLDQSILRLLEGRAGPPEHEAALAAVSAVREAGAAITLLGCTEIPLLLAEAARQPDLIDPTDLLADAVVRAAIG